MATDLDTGLSRVREKAGVGIGGHDPAGGPAWAASQRATDPAPAPTSRQWAPDSGPHADRRRKVWVS